MSSPTVIARVGDHVCVVEPASATWYVASEGIRLGASPADQPMLPEPAASGLDEVWIYTNLDCNLACTHCFVGDVQMARRSRPSRERIQSVVDEAVAMGAGTVFLTGGEPFARDDLPELLAYAAPAVRVVVLTNATLITPETIWRLDELGLRAFRDRLVFQVSIDGPPIEHDAMRGVGAFDRALAGVRNLIAWGARAALVTTLTAQNASSAHEVTALAGSLGLTVHHLLLPHTDGRLECDTGVNPATPKEILAAIRRCRTAAETAGVTLSNDAVIAGRIRRPGRRFDGCTGGSRMLVFGADGRVYPCPTLVGHDEFAVRVESLADARGCGPIARFAEASLCDRSECADCAIRHFCGGGCPAHAARANTDARGPEPYCEVYRGLVGDHIRIEAERLIASAGGRTHEQLRPASAQESVPVRYRDACT